MSAKARLMVMLGIVYVVYASSQLDFTYSRFSEGLGHAGTFLARMFPPNFSRWSILIKGLAESLEISVLASVLGILLALPLGLLGSRNLMPGWVSWPARAIVTLCRALHPVIVAILFVKAVGFGALAGILSLTVASMGFVGKLFTESIEEISRKQVEAIRATGASFGNVIVFAVLPQVFSRFVGFCTYQFDSNLRNSTMVGIVGAGGIGLQLAEQIRVLEWQKVSFLILMILVAVAAIDWISGKLRFAIIGQRALA